MRTVPVSPVTTCKFPFFMANFSNTRQVFAMQDMIDMLMTLWTRLVPQRRFNRILQRFFDGSLARFVTVMHETGSVITGSCA